MVKCGVNLNRKYCPLLETSRKKIRIARKSQYKIPYVIWTKINDLTPTICRVAVRYKWNDKHENIHHNIWYNVDISKHIISSKRAIPSNLPTLALKVCHCFHCFPTYLPCSDGTNAMIFVFWMLSFKPTFSLLSLSSRGSLVLLHFLP